jgi:hypothetical protein
MYSNRGPAPISPDQIFYIWKEKITERLINITKIKYSHQQDFFFILVFAKRAEFQAADGTSSSRSRRRLGKFGTE